MADVWSDVPGLKRSDSNSFVFKSFANSYFAPTMESPGSDLVVKEQLVKKNSNRGVNSSVGTPRPRQADEPDVKTPIRTPNVRVDGPGGDRSGMITMRPVIIKTDIPSVFKLGDMALEESPACQPCRTPAP
ncbi:hypothetical protein FNV43_RR26577 [Rhamnella rubrinervis]|uniref:Uncharacterized protein n=1 Tax=Rhamnella rubrinervis TaxID=2594499 RepID=A0A8K0DJZ0_9ROSA|nr:hypothetical protein FNV43_RR26577 [Rhamnella rubrinervis]